MPYDPAFPSYCGETVGRRPVRGSTENVAQSQPTYQPTQTVSHVSKEQAAETAEDSRISKSRFKIQFDKKWNKIMTAADRAVLKGRCAVPKKPTPSSEAAMLKDMTGVPTKAVDVAPGGRVILLVAKQNASEEKENTCETNERLDVGHTDTSASGKSCDRIDPAD